MIVNVNFTIIFRFLVLKSYNFVILRNNTN